MTKEIHQITIGNKTPITIRPTMAKGKVVGAESFDSGEATWGGAPMGLLLGGTTTGEGLLGGVNDGLPKVPTTVAV